MDAHEVCGPAFGIMLDIDCTMSVARLELEYWGQSRQPR